jgi:ferredoxin
MFRQMLSLLRSRRPMSLDLVLEAVEAHGKNAPRALEPHPTSPPRTPFASPTPGIRPSLARLGGRQRLRAARRMLPLLRDLRAAAAMHERPRPATLDRLEPERLVEIEGELRRLGVRDVGYVRVPATAVFAGHPIPHEHAIVFTVEMDEAPIATAPSFDCQVEVMAGYARLAKVARRLAARLRAEGCSAYPGTALGGTADYVQLGELAGLGVIGYHGLLITPGEGARVRIGVVYTNVANLPVDRPNPHAWVRDFCAMCRKCVRACPAEAIFDAPRPLAEGRHQTIDHGRCRDYFLENYGCGVCLAVCPFSVAGYDAIQARFRGNPTAPRFLLPVADAWDAISGPGQARRAAAEGRDLAAADDR